MFIKYKNIRKVVADARKCKKIRSSNEFNPCKMFKNLFLVLRAHG